MLLLLRSLWSKVRCHYEVFLRVLLSTYDLFEKLLACLTESLGVNFAVEELKRICVE